MRRFLFLAIGLLFSVFAYANPVTESQARQVALNWFTFKAQGVKSSVEIQNVEPYIFNGFTAMYIYEFKDGGFVIVAADDASIPILGYSVDNKLYRTDGTSNLEFQWWIEQYAQQIEQIKAKKIDNSATLAQWNQILNKQFPKGTPVVCPLLTTTWDQISPYNYYCPSNTPTGCVATSIAQIMKYWNWPPTGKYKHSYVHPTYGLQSADFKNTTYNWSAMLNNDDNLNHDVARLIYDLGVAVDMDYDPNGSGSQTEYLTYVLANYFQYNDSIKFVSQVDYTNADWIALLKSELDANRPIEYSGYSTSSGGHAFVFDGYDNTDYFHVNWGWGGQADGYFAVGGLNSSTYNFDFNQGNAAVINIKPDSNSVFKAVSKFSALSSVSTNASPYISYMNAVSTSVAWGIASDGSGSSADYRIYTKTTDGGLTWQAKKIENLGGTAFSMIYGLDDQTAFIAMYGTGASNNKVLRTLDGGTTWTAVKTGGHSNSFFNVVHMFDANNGIIQGDPDSEFEIYTTTDGGNNWTRVPGENIPDPLAGEFGIVGHYTAIADTIWFSTNKGRVYKSIDKGYNWTVYTIKATIATGYSTYIDLAFSDDGQHGVAHLTYSNSTTTTYEYYNTTNGGQTWNQITPTGNFYDGDLSAVPGTNNMFFSVGSNYEIPKMGISYSTDGGQTWTEYADYYKNFQFTAIDMVSAEKGYLGDFCGDYRGGAWSLGNVEPLVPNFSADHTLACINTNVVFTSSSTGDITTYTWNFGANATPATAVGIGPHTVQYSASGNKTVSLEISDGTTTFTKTKTDYISVADVAPSSIDTIYGLKKVLPNSTHTYNVDNQANVDFTWTTSHFSVTLLNNHNNTVNVTFPAYQNTFSVIVKGVNGCGESNSYDLPVQVTNTANEINDISNITTIAPNPAKDYIEIKCQENIQKVEILNISGQSIIKTNTNNESVILNIEDLTKGTYLIKINTTKGTTTQKFIKK